MELALTTVSSKGQVVIPSNVRKGFKQGDKLLVVREGNRLVLRKATRRERMFEEDREFLRRTQEALRNYDRGTYRKLSKKEFKEELRTW